MNAQLTAGSIIRRKFVKAQRRRAAEESTRRLQALGAEEALRHLRRLRHLEALAAVEALRHLRHLEALAGEDAMRRLRALAASELPACRPSRPIVS